MDLDQRSIVIFLWMQGKNAKDIEHEINDTLGSICVKYSTITKYIRKSKISQIPDQGENSEENHDHGENDLKIIEVLNEYPFASVRQIARTTGIPKSTVYFKLTQKLGFVNMHLKWVPHSLNDMQKKTRVSISKQLLKILHSAKHNGWNYFATGDESWFYLSYDYEQMWVASGNEPSKREKKMIGSEKVLLSVYWNPNGFLLIDALPKGSKFNADYYINNILIPLTENGTLYPDTNGRRLNLHVDNARPHTAKKSTQTMEYLGLKKVHHPTYSPDIAPSDFFLFGYAKEKLKGIKFNSRDELIQKVIEILNSIPKELLSQVFDEWERRLIQVIDTNGEYI